MNSTTKRAVPRSIAQFLETKIAERESEMSKKKLVPVAVSILGISSVEVKAQTSQVYPGPSIFNLHR
jgi:hypothetical protein